MDNQINNKFMSEALKEAQKAFNKGEVPVGAVIVHNGSIVARAHNLRESKKDPTAHAELIAIKKATKKLNSWRLCDCELYVTLEPCNMCIGAIKEARIKNVYFGAFDTKTINYKIDIQSGILENKCAEILKEFFKKIRRNNI